MPSGRTERRSSPVRRGPAATFRRAGRPLRRSTAAARGPTIDVMRSPPARRRAPLVAALTAILLLTATAATAVAARYPMTFDYTVRSVSVRQEWSEQTRGWPKKCRAWVKGRGFVTQKGEESGGTLTIDDNGAYVYGLTSDDRMRGSIERVITYRGHTIPETAECVPCGATEYGPCREERPDVIWHDTCGPKSGRFELHLMLTGSRLYTRPGMYDQDVLEHCEEPDYPGVDTGPSGLYIETVTAQGAGRALTRLKAGGRKTVRFLSRRGRCSRIGKVGEHTCETMKATIVFRRTS